MEINQIDKNVVLTVDQMNVVNIEVTQVVLAVTLEISEVGRKGDTGPSVNTYYEEFVYASGTQVFTIPSGTKVLSVHLNNAFLKKTLWTVVANLLTVSEPLVAFDEIIVTGIN